MALHIQLLDILIAFMPTRRGKITMAVLAVVLTAIVFLPYAISYSVRDWLNNNGADQSSVEDVNFNMFTGRLEFTNLRITVANNYTLLLQNAWVNIDWLPLFKKTFHVKEFFVENTDITIEQKADGQLVFGGIKPVKKQVDEKATPNANSDQAGSWGLGLDKLNIINSHFRYVRPNLDMHLYIDNASLTGLHSARKEPAQFGLQGNLNDAALEISASLLPFADKPSLSAKISLMGMPVTSFKEIARQHVGIQNGSLDINSKLGISYNPGKKNVSVNNAGKISLNELGIIQSGSDIKVGSFNWHGSINAVLPTSGTTPDVELQGIIGFDQLAVVNQLNNTALINIKAVDINDVKATTEGVHLQEVNIHSLVANLQRDEQGKIVLPKATSKEQEATAKAGTDANEKTQDATKTVDDTSTQTPQAPGSTFALRVDRILITDDSSIQFTDRSTTPTFESAIDLEKVSIDTLDSGKPEQAANFAIDGKIDKFSSLSASGTVHPFTDKFNLDMTAKLSALEMPPLSSYTTAMLGHYLLNGQLNSDIKVTIKDDIIDANSKLLVNNLEVKELTAEEKKKINTTASAPLGIGISMLSDRDKNIKLNLPFKGNINDPNLDISDAINQVIGKAISSAALAYLKLSLQPFGTLLAVADIAGSISEGVQLQPVIFTSSTSELDPAALEYKTKIAKIMTERPGLRLKVCGIATSRDRNALVQRELDKQKAQKEQDKATLPVITDETLIQIAKLRADNLKAALINDHNITAERLFSCLPKIDPEPGTDPRVEVGI